MKNIKHFIWSLFRSWIILSFTIVLLLTLILLSYSITSCSPEYIKNLFNVCISLLCGVVVSLVTSVINTFNSSIYASKQVYELVSNSCEELLDLWKTSSTTDLPYKLSERYSEFHMLYRKLCFLSEPISYTAEIKLISKKYAQLVKQLKDIQNSSEDAKIKQIETLARELKVGNYVL
jgi:hypothetical protein